MCVNQKTLYVAHPMNPDVPLHDFLIFGFRPPSLYLSIKTSRHSESSLLLLCPPSSVSHYNSFMPPCHSSRGFQPLHPCSFQWGTVQKLHLAWSQARRPTYLKISRLNSASLLKSFQGLMAFVAGNNPHILSHILGVRWPVADPLSYLHLNLHLQFG